MASLALRRHGLAHKSVLRRTAAGCQMVLLTDTRSVFYDNWYKVEQMRDKRRIKSSDKFFENKSLVDLLKFVCKSLAFETIKWFKEYREELEQDYKIALKHGDFDYLFRFNSPEDIEKWKTNADSNYKIGKTKANLTLTALNTGLFHGTLSDEYDRPERVKAIYTGYANMQSLTQYRSFYRQRPLDLREFTHLVMRVRGDGRTYAIVLRTPRYFTMTHTYQHMYMLYTRGGPYWQTVKIPLSKFFHVTHGRVSDRQYRVLPCDVTNLGFTLMDGKPGSFALEFDYIGLLRDNELYEEHAYETYKVPKYVSNS